jgi:hypothetical protein
MASPYHRWTSLLSVLFATGFALAEEEISFNRDIRPILSDKCFLCHGPDGENRQADLRLDIEEEAKEYAIVPGDPENSEVIERIRTGDADARMPPADSKLSLTPQEIETLRKWVEAGAPWNNHWAFVPPSKATPPDVANDDWPINEIDRFVLHRLEREKCEPSPMASRERLIRRVAFDLTGLPPTLDEIDAFLADESDDAYEKLVDRLLASPRFGERMAANWLDVARYSDTYGYQVDRDRYVWPWRDWVIQAINDNMPYDQFITEQLAGDLLPNADDDQILATTFNRLHPQKVEGGSTPEEFRIEYVADRTQTFGTAFLGLTFECARCHDHKYDPIEQKEYYQVSAFFDNIDEAGLYSFFTNSVPTPTLRLTNDAAKTKLADLDEQIADAVAELEARQKGNIPAGEEVKSEITGRVAHLDFEAAVKGPNQSVPGKVGRAVKLTGDDAIGAKVGNFPRWQPFSVALWMNTPDEKDRAVVFHRSRAWTDAASRGYQLLIEDGRLSASLIHFWPGNAIRVRTRDKIATNQWLHVAITYDGSSQAAGLKIFVNGKPADCEVVRDNLYKNITGGGGDHIAIGERFRDRGFTNGLVDEFQVFDRRLTAIEIAQLHDGESLTKLLAAKRDTSHAGDQQRLREFLLETTDADYRSLLDALKKLRQQRCQTEDGIAEIMVMRETSEPHPTYFLRRGAYDAREARVYPETPSVLPPFPDDLPRNRLGLARWLTTPDHPLASRVAVNRFWQAIFGRGLVATPEDFGSQGTPPTHPELLDWLAKDLQENGWDVKRLVKQMVMSATYRQASDATPEMLERDPENLLFARAPSYRLSAEMLRDNALAVSGLLVDKIGGAPTRPYDLEVSFKPVGRTKGEGLYRRSLYTYWKRTAPAPAMMTLDASKRDVCRMRRERTSSPLQAFVLMNGPQFVEASRMLAERLIEEHGDAIDEIVVDMFRKLTGRQPSEDERSVLKDLFDKQKAYFAADAKRAEKYLGVGDAPRNTKIDPTQLAALAAVANTLLNFDESVMKR